MEIEQVPSKRLHKDKATSRHQCSATRPRMSGRSSGASGVTQNSLTQGKCHRSPLQFLITLKFISM